MKHGRPKSQRPARASVASRWFLPAKTPFVSVPIPALLAFGHEDAGLALAEVRVLLWLVADWWWPGGLERQLNVPALAKRCGMRPTHAHRALGALHEKGFVTLFRRGNGLPPTVSIKPLVERARRIASGEGPVRSDTEIAAGSGTKSDLVGPTPDLTGPTRWTNPEPKSGDTESSPTDVVRREARKPKLALVKKPDEELRRQAILDEIARAEREAKERNGGLGGERGGEAAIL